MMVFQATLARLPKRTEGKNYEMASSGTFDPGEIASDILPTLKGGQLFAYLFRRFGYPNLGWDSGKNLVSYLLTTPEQDVLLTVTPYMGGDYERKPSSYSHARYMFGYCVSEQIVQEYHFFYKNTHYLDYEMFTAFWEKTDTGKRCVSAFELTIRDLLRPVHVRDIPINCLGTILDDHDTPLPEHADHFAAAGYPVPMDLFEDTQRYLAFYQALLKLGEGDIGKGMESVIAYRKEKENK